MEFKDFKKFDLPDKPGVYFFKNDSEILYVGKATSLKDRVRSYFTSTLLDGRGPKIVKMIQDANSIFYETTDSVLEALILEANYIKKYKPHYNSLDKDDKSFNYVLITEEKWPQVVLMRGKDLQEKSQNFKLKAFFGPFPHGSQLKEALKIIRKIFPYRDEKCTPADQQNSKKPPRACFNHQIGLCPGVCTGEITNTEYKKIIRNLILFFQGKKRQVAKNLEKQMKEQAKNHNFEGAQESKRKIFSLNHIRDVSLLKKEELTKSDAQDKYRIEAYDIAHISGSETVGVMVVMENGKLAKNEYRKFKIRGNAGISKGKIPEVKIDDTQNLGEVIKRRLKHSEWSFPDLMVVDGGIAQINVAKKILREINLNIDIVSVVKDEKHKAKEIIKTTNESEKHEKEILLINSEAHRFAIAFHRNRRRKNAF